MTGPDELRKEADRLLTGGSNYLPLRNRLYAAADAWELQRYDLAKSKEEIEHLLKRLEEAGKYHSAAEACMELESDLAAR